MKSMRAAVLLTFWILAVAPLSSQTYRTTQPVPAFHPAHPTQVLGSFTSGSVLEWVETRPNGMILVRFHQPGGQIIEALCRAGDLEKVETPASPLAANPVPSSPTESSPPTPSPAKAPVVPPMPDELSTPGWKTISLNSLPKPAKMLPWMKYDFDAAKEKFLIYIPNGLKPNQPCGLMAWYPIGSGLDLSLKPFSDILDEFGILLITAKDVGNKEETNRRIGLLACAAQQLQKHFNLDPKRCFTSGLDNGGRMASTAYLAHPTLWSGGALCISGVIFYKDCDNLDNPLKPIEGINHDTPNFIPSSNSSSARSRCKTAIITGPKDKHVDRFRSIYRAMKQDGFKALLVEQPDFEGGLCSSDSFRKGVEFIVGPPPKH